MNITMATRIASIPVLTGEVAERFEQEAQKTYQQYLNRSEEERKEIRTRYEEGIRKVRAMLAKSKMGIG
jgi:vacuolar-type H+-ATPase subunit H